MLARKKHFKIKRSSQKLDTSTRSITNMPITSVADPDPEINEISSLDPYSNPDPKLCFGSATLPRTKAGQETFDRIV